MKIYFGFTVAGDRSSLEAAGKIVELLAQMGHEVLTRHLVRDDAWEADRRVTPQEVYQRDIKWLEQCDLFMAEVSGSSFGVGFETGYLLGATDTKIVLFFRRDAANTISLINGHSSSQLHRRAVFAGRGSRGLGQDEPLSIATRPIERSGPMTPR